MVVVVVVHKQRCVYPYRCGHASTYGASLLTADPGPAPVCRVPKTRLHGARQRTQHETTESVVVVVVVVVVQWLIIIVA